MKQSRFFTLEELLTSSTARQRSIENLPSWTIVEHLNYLACEVLDPIREAWGSGIRVSSGFRNKALNSAVGGVERSCHQIGYAVDIVPSNGKFDEFVAFLKEWLPKFDKGWDQCIIESKGKSKWVHLGWVNWNGGQRRQLFDVQVPVK